MVAIRNGRNKAIVVPKKNKGFFRILYSNLLIKNEANVKISKIIIQKLLNEVFKGRNSAAKKRHK